MKEPQSGVEFEASLIQPTETINNYKDVRIKMQSEMIDLLQQRIEILHKTIEQQKQSIEIQEQHIILLKNN